jgi:hypothetical protein
LLGDELSALALHLWVIAGRNTVPSAELMRSDRFLSTAEWHRNKDLLAEMLDDEQWERLPILYHNVETFRYRLTVDQPGTELEPGRALGLFQMTEEAAQAAFLLTGVHPTLGGDDPEQRLILTDLEGNPIPVEPERHPPDL